MFFIFLGTIGMNHSLHGEKMDYTNGSIQNTHGLPTVKLKNKDGNISNSMLKGCIPLCQASIVVLPCPRGRIHDHVDKQFLTHF